MYITISFSFESVRRTLVNFPDEKVPTELKKAIMQARQDKKLTQAQLAQVYTSNSLWTPPKGEKNEMDTYIEDC